MAKKEIKEALESKHIRRLVDEALAIEAEDAKSAGALAFMARALVLATMPHSKPEGLIFKRQNGFYTLRMVGHEDFGLPYGSLPRLLLVWLTTQAVRYKTQVLSLGDTLTEFLNELGLARQGGKRGDITRLRNQMFRLFTTSVSCTYHDKEHGRAGYEGYNIAKSFDVWWNPLDPDEDRVLSQSVVTLSSDFYNEIIERPVPVDFRVLKALSRSPMQIDIHVWLNHRMSYVKVPTNPIPWPVLKMQFGADYADNAQGIRDFKKSFLKNLLPVKGLYKDLKVEEDKHKNGLILCPSPTHVPKLIVANTVAGR